MPRLLRSSCALLLFAAVASAAAPPGNRDRDGDPLPRGATLRLGSLRYRLPAGCGSFSLSADGKRAFCVSALSFDVFVMDVATGKVRPLAKLAHKADAVPQTLAVSPACDRVLAFDGTEFAAYDVLTGKRRWSFKAASAGTTPVFDPAGTHFARFEPDANKMGEGIVFVHRSDDGKQTGAARVKGQAVQFALSPGGTRLLTWDQLGDPMAPQLGWDVVFWDAAKGKETGRLTLRRGIPFAGFRPDGKEAAIAAGASVSLVDPATAKVTRTLRAAAAPYQVVYSPDGKYLCTAGRSRADLWEVAAWKRVPTRPLGEFSMTCAVAFPAPGKLLVGGVIGREAFFTDARSGKLTRPTSGHGGAVTSLHFSAGRVLTAGGDGAVVTWDRAGRALGSVTVVAPRDAVEGKGIAPLLRQDFVVPGDVESRLTFSPSGRWLTGLSGFVYDRRAGEARFDDLSNLAGAGGGTESLCIAADADVLFAAGLTDDAVNRQGASALTALGLDNGEQLWSIEFRGLSPFRLAASPDAKTVAVASAVAEGRMSVSLFDGKTGKPFAAREFERAGNVGSMLEFTADGRLLVGVNEGGAFVLDARTGEPLHSFDLEGFVTGAALCPRGRMLAIAKAKDDADLARQTILVMELSTGKVRLAFNPADAVTALCFSPDGRLLGSGHEDGTAMLWHLEPERTTTPDAWKRLSGDDAGQAWRAAWQLRRTPDEAVALVRKQVRPAPPGPPAADVERLIAALGDEDADARDDAEQQLHKHGRAVEVALRAALKGAALEQSRRVKRLLSSMPSAYVDPVGLRGVELLEAVGGEQAKAALLALTKGNESAMLTQEAKAALARLAKAKRD